MRRKRFLPAWLLLLLLAAIVIATWYRSPANFLKTVDPKEISAIHVSSGHSGNRFEITDPQSISYIVETIQSTSFQRYGLTLSYVGFWYSLSFCNESGESVEGFTVNSDMTIRSDPFFYLADRSMDITDYLLALETESCSE